MANERTKGSVPNVKRAMREGAAGRNEIASKVNKRRSGSVGSRLNDSTAKALRGPKRRNS